MEKEKEMKNEQCVAFIVENDFPSFIRCGTHNGYVAVPPGNRYHGKHYNMLNKQISVHGDLTLSEPAVYSEYAFGTYNYKLPDDLIGKRNTLLDFAEFVTEEKMVGDDWWIFGFDTVHFGDDESAWNREAVIKETMRLKAQLEK